MSGLYLGSLAAVETGHANHTYDDKRQVFTVTKTGYQNTDSERKVMMETIIPQRDQRYPVSVIIYADITGHETPLEVNVDDSSWRVERVISKRHFNRELGYPDLILYKVSIRGQEKELWREGTKWFVVPKKKIVPWNKPPYVDMELVRQLSSNK